MSTFPTPDRPPLTGYQTTPQYSRPLPGPSTTPAASVDSPDRYVKPTPVQQVTSHPVPQSPYQSTESSSTYAQPTAQPQPPITPLSGNHYASQPPPSSGSGSYFGVAQTPTDQAIPSPPPTSTSRPGSSNANYTPEGVPIVPVGISGGKMFRCVGYGDCNKVFTRSEHLARHIRKHTGERPFPCHCSKAFSRLDNLRQHAATVHADQAELNEQMLQSLASVHAALSQRANREQRARGEVVEVPKNAVERRHVDTTRRVSPRQMGAPYDAYGHTGPVATDWHIPPPQPGRPRTGGGYEYYQAPPDGHPVPPFMDAGPSRRPSTSAGAYPGYPPAPMYYDQTMRPPTSSGQPLSAPHEMTQLPYPYRPMSSNGRELPIPVHYAGSEPPPSAHSAHGHPPPSPMYPHGAAGPQPGQWTSPTHPTYPQGEYHAQPGPAHDSFAYPPEAGQGHGYAPPPSPYGYTAPAAYYPPQQYGQVPAPYAPAQGPYPPPPGYSHPPHAHLSLPPPSNPGPTAPPSIQAAPTANPPESPFSYSAPQPLPQGQEYYGTTYYDPRKRRTEDDVGPRKMPRTDMPSVTAASESLNDATDRGDPTWFPPNTERRSSLAISALLGSPQQVPRSRPTTAEVAPQSSFEASYTFPPVKSGLGQGSSLPATPMVNGTRGLKDEVKQEPVGSAMA